MFGELLLLEFSDSYYGPRRPKNVSDFKNGQKVTCQLFII